MIAMRTILCWTRQAATLAAGGVLLAACAAQPPAPAPTGPQGARGTPEGCAADKLADDALVGKTEAEVIGLLQGCAWRLGERDGQQFPGTMDYNPQRRTLGVKAGKVVWVRRG
ncbi:hypothetical protein CNE_1c07680 [Cupriavidus necator N-1]|jgi:hypothetical protein|uniref:Lipoprotein n=1 Tax=Cupriavidus necator (strain ATCC 43291 / DSM 13513 / CCUG 52238 / LMG 8453 / N-1) TaxID=1042878 RepID=G0EXM7_CUPNN|nr:MULTISPECIES: hypothetical protein [Cupriavidus]AEI76132.1 hypothetical protein CNE_1c07680 [Cupriavidus necator N-1]KAI3609177.1 hypothetical protein D8I24_0955 [Cupriavidus necator H850]MDX6011740.1 hypothetical protein [Cupriavidus necator]QUN29148.1 hypothetical protein KB879_04065 [Cupriavidus sp. KK10]